VSFPQVVPVPQRLAASTTLVGVVAFGVIAPLFLPLHSTGAATTPTEQATTGPIRVVDAPSAKTVDAPRAKEPSCAEQAWPYIQASCPIRAGHNAPLGNKAPSASAPPVAPSVSAPQIEPAPQMAVAQPSLPVLSQPVPSNPEQVKGAENPSTVGTLDDKAEVPRSVRLPTLMPTPPGAEPQLPGAMLPSAPPPPDAPRAGANVGTAAAGLAAVALHEPNDSPRAERQGRGIHSSHKFRLFGFRIIGRRF
jgi:hypothetical protein